MTLTYDFSEDAMGLADFIQTNLDDKDISPVVYVADKDGNPATKAVWKIEKLTDGSKGANLTIHFG